MMSDETVTVTILRSSATARDKYGDPPAGATGSRVDVAGCLVAPRMSTESTERGNFGVVVGWWVFAPAGTVIHFDDEIELEGGGTDPETGEPILEGAIVCRIEGEPAAWSLGTVVTVVRA